MAAHPETGEADLVLVHLADVPEAVRLRVADRLIEEEDLERVSPELAILLRIRAIVPVQNPGLFVKRTKLRLGGIRR